jgi:hypothetical protein
MGAKSTLFIGESSNDTLVFGENGVAGLLGILLLQSSAIDSVSGPDLK